MYILMASVVIGIVLGLVGGKVWILIPWGILALFIGYFSKKRNIAIGSGVFFGFFVSFFFMVRGYTGAPSLISRVPFFFLIGLFGAICGLIASFAGYIIYKGLKKSKK